MALEVISQDTFLLKIAGKAQLPEAVDIGVNYHVSLEGAITSLTETDNDNGSRTKTWLFKPIKIDLLDPIGKTLKLKDTRSHSALLRSLLWKRWKDAASSMDFDTWYNNFMLGVMRDCDLLISQYDLK